ncbi:cellulase [Streptomyces capillispiralis]|uniref:Cellulase n=1 Tax=Streptomyces capillispiralis TaxID=68182 RepID=A0A561TQT5_9ACTN|nr:cellulase [Streptomyces capillispiralis]TWF89469.1 hypothetical protein FHX78_116512 [Streptomyces capillispiralis]GHH93554.1 hypothetical protein GCM10017779_40110 [Streptomyces capillispiralis]
MDDFEQELTRMMRDSGQRAPFAPEHRRRLYQGIRARRRSRLLWRAGGSALAVTGLGVGLALLSAAGSRPADHRPLPATSPSAPASSPAPTTHAPSTSHPPTSTPGTTAPGSAATSVPPPTSTPSGGAGGTTTPAAPPVTSVPPATPPSTARGPSVPADGTTSGSG